MINLQVIHIKKIIRYFLLFTTTIIIIGILINHFFKKDIVDMEGKFEEENKKDIKIFEKYSFLDSLKIAIPSTDTKNLEENTKNNNEKKVTVRNGEMLKRLLNTEITMIDNITDENVLEKQETENEKTDGNEKEEKIQLATKNVEIEKVLERNIEASYSFEENGVKIKNQSSYTLTSEMLKDDYLPQNLKNVLIFHTHTCESYTESEKYKYTMTGNYRTTDLNYSVAKVGDELTTQLQEYGFNVIHDKTVHDYPSYNGSYNRSLETVENILNNNENTDIVIDLHRDAVGNGNDYGPTVKINGESVAQIMLVIGSDGGGLKHPNWQRNLKIAMRLQKNAEELYPGLFRPMIVRDSRYNQQVRDGAMIIEVGATANTLDESLASMKYLAVIFNETFK